ncbi:MAG: diguanylate cyclase domain-containing protein [Acidiferrobacteraceae bacterium]
MYTWSGSEQEQAMVRILYVLITSIFLNLASTHHWDRDAHRVLIGLFWFLGYSTVWFLFVLLFPDGHGWRRPVAIVMDVLAVSYTVAELHTLGIVFVPIYISIAIGNGLRYGFGALYLALGVDVAGFVTSCAYNPFWIHNRVLEVGLLGSIVGIPPIFSALLARLHRSRHELARLYGETEQLTRQDVLTGLPNIKLLGDFLARSLTLVERHGRVLAVLFLDLDGFKRINDSLGHAAGDVLLKEAAARMATCIRRSDIVARVGGDEFVIVLTELCRMENAEGIAQKLLTIISGSPFVLGDTVLVMTASIGIAIFPLDGKDPDTLIKHADMAMYQAKQMGRNRYARYDRPGARRPEIPEGASSQDSV